MSVRAQREALKEHVRVALSGIAGVWRNVRVEGTVPVPRYEFDLTAPARTGGLSPGEYVHERGTFVLTAVTVSGKGESEALAMVDAMITAIPDGATISFSGGRLRVTGPAVPSEGYLDNTEWRMPVRFRYQAFFP